MSSEEFLKIVRGNDVRLEVVLTLEDGSPCDLTGVTALCSVKDKPAGRKLFDAIVTIVDRAEGRIEVFFPKERTSELIAGQFVYFDLRLTFADGSIINVPVPSFRAAVVDPIT